MKKLIMILACIIASVGLSVAQTTRVSGTILDDTGETVIGASVVAKGTTVGTVTDVDGKFSLNIPSDKKTLVLSLIGMKTKEVAAGTNLRIVMESDSKLMDEVIVVAYGTTTKASFTGSASTVSSDKISGGSKESLDKALVGKVSGVRVSSNTGDPGAAGDISIRGINTLNGTTTPLYVIDGIPFDAGSSDMGSGLKSMSLLSTINPEEVETITVLKDAAASSLYGSRAVNGVVIITTKKGKAGKTRVSYKGELGITKMAIKQFEMADAATTLDYYREGLANYYMHYGHAADKQAGYEMVKSEGDMEYFFPDPTGRTNTNWWDKVYRNGSVQEHQVSLVGGNDKTKVYASLGYNKTEGIVKGSDFARISGRLNVDHTISKAVSVSLRQNIVSTNQNGFRDQSDQAQGIGTSSPVGILFAMNPTATVYNENGTINANAGWGQVSNPLLMLGSADEFVKSDVFRSISNGDITIKFLPELTFKSSLAYDFINAQHQEFWGPTSVNGASLNGLGYRDDVTKKVFTTSSTLRYAKEVNGNAFDVLAGFESMESHLQTFSGSAKDYTTGKLPELSVGQPYRVGSAKYGSSMLSYFGQINYNYNNKYYAAASLRGDGSSFLGSNNRWANFVSGSLAWRMKEEDFLKDNSTIHDLKLRASIGTSGNLPSSYYENLALFSFTGGYGPQGAIYWSQIGNADLGWEKTTTFNVGADLNLFGRVGFSLEYFNKKTSDLLLEVPVSLVVGFDQILTNTGNLKNHGLEFEVNSQNIISKDFSWQTDFNFTWMKNKITSLPDNADIPAGDGEMYIQRVGESIYSFNLPVWKGVNPETGLGQFMVDPNDASKGLTNYYSQAGKTVVGKPSPDVMGGITNTFKYKDFDFSALVSYQFGGKLFDYPGYFGLSDGVRMGSFGVLKEAEGNYWRNPGDIVDNPKPIYGNPYRSDRWSSRHILSTDNIRLRELSVGYNVPVKNFEFLKNALSSCRVYFKANNLAMIWSKEKDIDPDVSLIGYRQVDTPVTKSFVFGLNVEF